MDFSTSDTANAPRETPSIRTPSLEGLWERRNTSVPWHGNTYMILEKATDRAITLSSSGNLRLADINQGQGTNHIWLCVEKDGYFGFHNPASGKYIGHNGEHAMYAQATELRAWEFLTPRQHPEGGYQLLSPYSDTLRVVSISQDGRSLVTRPHGTTLWVFVKV